MSLRSALLSLAALAAGFAAPAASQTWTSAPAMSTPRTGAAWAVLGGRLYVMGGRAAGGTLLRSAEVFDPATGWSAIDNLRDARTDAQAVVLNGRIYLIGGEDDEGPSDDVDVYRPDANDWDSGDNLRTERDGPAAGAVGGRIYAIGGAARSGAALTSAETYDGDDWSAYPAWTLAPARAHAGSATLGGAVVVAGGFSTFGPLDAVVRFVPNQSPTVLPSLPSPRGALALAAAGGTLFAVGGRNAADAPVGAVDRLGPGATAWTALPSLPEARVGAVAAVLGTDLFVVGGTGPFGSVLASAVRLNGAAVADESGPDGVPGVTLALDGPNPTRGPVRVRFSLAEAGPVRMAVVDVRGREVAVLADGFAATGPQTAVWNASGLAAGVYAVRLATPTGAVTVRLVLAR